jgi:hypothetical protein
MHNQTGYTTGKASLKISKDRKNKGQKKKQTKKEGKG